MMGHPIHFESHSMFSIYVILDSVIATLILATSCVQAYQSHQEDTGHVMFYNSFACG